MYGAKVKKQSRVAGEEKLEPVVGIEPTTDGLQNRCSTTELHWPPVLNGYQRRYQGSELSAIRQDEHSSACRFFLVLFTIFSVAAPPARGKIIRPLLQQHQSPHPLPRPDDLEQNSGESHR